MSFVSFTVLLKVVSFTKILTKVTVFIDDGLFKVSKFPPTIAANYSTISDTSQVSIVLPHFFPCVLIIQ